MLVLALSATLVGFVLLVSALLSGVLWLAIACVVVCVIGVGFLIADLLGLGRSSSAATRSDADAPHGSDADSGDAGSGDADSGDAERGAPGGHGADSDVSDDEVVASDQEQARDWSAAAEHEEDPATGDSSEGHTRNAGDDVAGSEADTGEIPRTSKHGRRDDPPTEEFFLDKPR